MSAAYSYVRRTYGVDPKVGQRITVNGRPGTIIRPQSDPKYLRVRFDDAKAPMNAHPTWEVDYAPKETVHAE